MSRAILIVDDEIHLVRILEFVLKRAGYETIAAHDGRRGLEMALERSPDLVILDLTLPVLDGVEACRAMKRAAALRGMPVIMLTAHDVARRKNGEPDGPDLWMEKPFDTGALLERIEELLGRGPAPLG